MHINCMYIVIVHTCQGKYLMQQYIQCQKTEIIQIKSQKLNYRIKRTGNNYCLMQFA